MNLPLVLFALAGIRVALLPLAGSGPDAPVAEACNALLAEVLADLDGLSPVPPADAPIAERVEALRRRCGDQPDCRQQIGRLLGAQVLVFGSAAALGESAAVVELELFEVGPGRTLGRLSRTLSGSAAERRLALESVVVESLLPEHMTGRLVLHLSPSGAALMIDGRVRLERAGELVEIPALRAGRHSLRLSRAGYADTYAVIQVSYRGTTELDIALQPQPAPEPGARRQP